MSDDHSVVINDFLLEGVLVSAEGVQVSVTEASEDKPETWRVSFGLKSNGNALSGTYVVDVPQPPPGKPPHTEFNLTVQNGGVALYAKAVPAVLYYADQPLIRSFAK